MEKFLTNFKVKSNNSNDNSAKTNKSKPTPWVEKYRPKTMDDIVYQTEIVNVLRKCIDGADFPNLLFYGPPGTGKTSTILAAAKELFGPLYYKDRVLELNASDERGIAVIREKVKNFSKNASTAKAQSENGGQRIPGFKLVILDEADSMTHAAQSALRRTMEVTSKSTRFCLICNYVTRIIDPLTSRCSKFRFKTLDKEVAIARLMHISDTEDIKTSKDTLLRLVELSEGDLRRSITMLQSASLLATDGNVDEELLMEVAGTIPASCIAQLMETVRSNSFDRVQDYIKSIIRSGYALAQLLVQLQDVILNFDINDKVKAVILEKLALCEEQLMGGADEYLQLMSLSCFMMQQFASI